MPPVHNFKEELIVGNSYKTYNGLTFVCREYNPASLFPFAGYIMKGLQFVKIGRYTKTGNFLTNPSLYDIVAKIN